MRRYETISIIRPSVGEDEIEAISQKTADIITSGGGIIINTDKWGLKKLAYPIQKELQGYYIYTVFAAKPAEVNEMERIFKINDQILKFMTIKLQDVYTPDPEGEPVVIKKKELVFDDDEDDDDDNNKNY